MKQGIHPDWHHDTKVTCSCGNTFTIGSITDTLQVDICNKCHPFFTGELKFVDRQGRVDKFKKKMEAAANRQKTRKAKRSDDQQSEAKSYREILREQQAAMRKSSKDAAKAAQPAADTTADPDKTTSSAN
jgi:large subunit ribosomal protein L31